MAYIVSEQGIRQALSSRPPATASIVHAQGDLVRIYRENDKKLMGPYGGIRVDEKEVYVG